MEAVKAGQELEDEAERGREGPDKKLLPAQLLDLRRAHKRRLSRTCFPATLLPCDSASLRVCFPAPLPPGPQA